MNVVYVLFAVGYLVAVFVAAGLAYAPRWYRYGRQDRREGWRFEDWGRASWLFPGRWAYAVGWRRAS